MTRGNHDSYTPEQRINACADYLIGMPVKQIECKHNIPVCTIIHWIRRAGFKTRYDRENNHPSLKQIT